MLLTSHYDSPSAMLFNHSLFEDSAVFLINRSNKLLRSKIGHLLSNSLLSATVVVWFQLPSVVKANFLHLMATRSVIIFCGHFLCLLLSESKLIFSFYLMSSFLHVLLKFGFERDWRFVRKSERSSLQANLLFISIIFWDEKFNKSAFKLSQSKK